MDRIIEFDNDPAITLGGRFMFFKLIKNVFLIRFLILLNIYYYSSYFKREVLVKNTFLYLCTTMNLLVRQGKTLTQKYNTSMSL